MPNPNENKNMKKINKLNALKKEYERRCEELKAQSRHVSELQEKLAEIEKMFPENSYSYLPQSDRTVTKKVLELVIWKNRHEGRIEGALQENRRLWHMIRSLTGDKTLELPRQKIFTRAPDGTERITDGDYDPRFYSF